MEACEGVLVCTCVGVFELVEGKQSDGREGRRLGGDEGWVGTKMASWHAGQACTPLSAHPSSFLQVLPVSARMCASGFQLK